jgi:hypothetical protein
VSIERALQAYEACYGRLPSITKISSNEVDNAELLMVLMAETNAKTAAEQNPKGMKFLNVSGGSLANGQFVDPWKHPYHIAFSSESKIVLHQTVINHSVAIWSDGPNGTNEYGLGDDVHSW